MKENPVKMTPVKAMDKEEDDKMIIRKGTLRRKEKVMNKRNKDC